MNKSAQFCHLYISRKEWDEAKIYGIRRNMYARDVAGAAIKEFIGIRKGTAWAQLTAAAERSGIPEEKLLAKLVGGFAKLPQAEQDALLR